MADHLQDTADTDAAQANGARDKAARRRASPTLRQALVWHAVWAAACLAALAGLELGPGLPWTSAAAVLVGAAPAFAALLLRRWDKAPMRALLLVLWAAAGAGACVLAGGVGGPLAAWCLAPLAAAAVFGGSRRMAEAAALSLAAAAVAVLAGLAGIGFDAPGAPAAGWMGALAVASVGFGLGAGQLLWRRRSGERDAQARAAEAELADLLADQPNLILALDRDGRILSAYGRSPQGMMRPNLPGASPVGVDIRALVDAADRVTVSGALAAAARGGTGTCRFAPAGAPERTCALSVRGSDEGRITAAVRDATAERARERSLESARDEAEALNTGKSRFLANMSHELRTPLNAVMGFSDVLRQQLFGDMQPRYVEYAEMIHESGRHLLDLINDVLDISKIEAARYELSREVFDARDAVSGALRLMRLQADQSRIALRGLLPPEPLEADADRRALKQIVLNLVSNALKFTPAGGQITVALRGDGEDLEIVVTDTGVGIAEADVERLGKPYEQAGDAAHKEMGSGLGLSLVRAFAELHGGGMAIESRLGEGTSVTVRMPVLHSPRAATPPLHSAKIIAFSPQR